ncbi:MAG: murein L,D-transpeptidase family protein [Verrucomicrobiota bacterium]
MTISLRATLVTLFLTLSNSLAMANDRFSPIKARLSPQLQKTLHSKNLALGQPIFIRIFKEESELELWIQSPNNPTFALFKTYPICSWSGTLGPKLKQGDRQAPEGFYFVNRGRMNPKSKYHLSFNLGYPNEYDRQHHRTGDFLMVHGNCVSIGCFAMTDPLIEEIYTIADAALTNGQPFFRVHCFPFRMTKDRLQKAADSEKEKQWLHFWQNLKEGHDFFETHQSPPNTTVQNRTYTFSHP